MIVVPLLGGILATLFLCYWRLCVIAEHCQTIAYHSVPLRHRDDDAESHSNPTGDDHRDPVRY